MLSLSKYISNLVYKHGYNVHRKTNSGTDGFIKLFVLTIIGTVYDELRKCSTELHVILKCNVNHVITECSVFLH